MAGHVRNRITTAGTISQYYDDSTGVAIMDINNGTTGIKMYQPVDIQKLSPGVALKTLDSAAHTIVASEAGYALTVSIASAVVTLVSQDSINTGMILTFYNEGSATGATGITLSPAAADTFVGVGLVESAGKDIVNTKATANPGDYLKISYGFGNTIFVVEKKGIWAREA